MSMYDWNNDGNKDSFDDFMEYQIYEDSKKDSDSYSGNRYSGSSGKELSGLEFIGYVFGGFAVTCFLFSGVNMEYA